MADECSQRFADKDNHETFTLVLNFPSVGHFDGRAANHSKSTVDSRSSVRTNESAV